MGACGSRPFSILEVCGEERLVLHEGRYRGRQTLPCFTLYDITLHANFLRLFHELTALVHGKDEDRRFWSECVDSAGGVESIHQRHGDVEDDKVGDRFFDFFDGFESVRGLVADIKRDQGCERQANAFTDARLVICYQNSQKNSLLLTGLCGFLNRRGPTNVEVATCAGRFSRTISDFQYRKNCSVAYLRDKKA
jgi:hypothetical protein